MLKKISLIIVILFVIFLAGALYLGFFNSVSVAKKSTGPYRIACLDNIGPYKDVYKKIQNVKKLLDEQKITPVESCGIYFDDPKKVSADKLRSKAGYLLKEDAKLEILGKMYIPQREVVVATLKAHPAVAPWKTYSAINKWLAANNYEITGPALEIYHAKGIVEVQMPISPKKIEEKKPVKKEPTKKKEVEKKEVEKKEPAKKEPEKVEQ